MLTDDVVVVWCGVVNATKNNAYIALKYYSLYTSGI